MSSLLLLYISLTTLLLLSNPTPTLSNRPHTIQFRSPNLYPEGLTWDPLSQHFLVGSLHHRSLHSVSDAGVIQTLITDLSLPLNVTFLGLSVDSLHRRLLAAVTAMPPLPPFSALASYDLRTNSRIFLVPLHDPENPQNPNNLRPIANDVAVDFNGNAYVTDSANNLIWKIDIKGEPSVFSRSPVFRQFEVDPKLPYSFCGLNGIAYVSKGYLLVVQSNTGKMFKVNAEDGSARVVMLSEDLMAADGIVVRNDGVVVVVSQFKAWLLKSDDSWGQGVVYDEIELDVERFPTSVTVRGGDRDRKAYVLYGHVDEGTAGNVGREVFGIEEIESKKEAGEEDEKLWPLLLLGLGLAYFMYWRFQMGKLVTNMNKKTA